LTDEDRPFAGTALDRGIRVVDEADWAKFVAAA